MIRLWRLIVSLVIIAVSPVAMSAEPASSPRRADLLKAGYLLNFVKFIDWPPSVSQDSLMICTMGAQGLHSALTSDSNERQVGTRKVTFRSVNDQSSVQGCAVLYVDSTLPASEARLVCAAARTAPVLTISDRKEFVREGGVIGVFTEDNRLRFNVNVENARRVGLRISSALLELASRVERDAS